MFTRNRAMSTVTTYSRAMSSMLIPRAVACRSSGRGRRRAPPSVVASSSWSERHVRNIPNRIVYPLAFMGIPLLAGRVFTDQDTATTQKVAIVDEAFVMHYFAGDIEKTLQGNFGFGGGNHARAASLGDGCNRQLVRWTNTELSPNGCGNPLGFGKKSPTEGHVDGRCCSACRMSRSNAARRSGTPGRMTDAARKWTASGSGPGLGTLVASAL